MKPKTNDDEMVTEPNEPTVKELMRMLIEMRKGDQELQRESLRQTRKRSNTQGPDISAFNPQGQKDYPMPDLAFEVLAPWPCRPGFMHGMTVEEVKLMNRVKPGEVVLQWLDETEVRCSIIAQKNVNSGKIERLAFMGSKDEDSGHYTSLFTRERKIAQPSLVNILHQILDQQGTDYSDVLSMKEINRRIALPVDHADRLPISLGE